MKAPNLPSFRPSRPLAQDGQSRGLLPPLSLAGKKCGPSSSSSLSSTSLTRRSLVSPTAAEKAFQNSRSTWRQSILPSGDLVELFLEMGGEVVFDVAREVGLQEGGDDAAAILGHEALAVDLHVVAALQHLDDAGVGRGPADAELLELLHQAGLGIARRRLGEMLLRQDVAAVERLVWRDVGQDRRCLPRPRSFSSLPSS